MKVMSTFEPLMRKLLFIIFFYRAILKSDTEKSSIILNSGCNLISWELELFIKK